MTEKQLRREIAHRPGSLRYPDAVSLREFKWGDAGGTADVVLLPQKGRHRIAVIETKICTNRESHAQVVGQLLKYLCHGALFSASGVELLRKHVGSKTVRQSAAQLLRKSERDALKAVRDGRPIGPTRVGLHIVVDRCTDAMRRRLLPITTVLRRAGIRITVWQRCGRGEFKRVRDHRQRRSG